MRPTLLIPAALLLLAADAPGRLVAVLPLDLRHAKGRIDNDGRAVLEEMLRDAAANALGPAGWTVLTGETMLQILHDDGVDPLKCGDDQCHLQAARELKVDRFISGSVQFVDGQFTAVVRLIDSRTGTILTSVMLEGASVSALRKDFHGKEAEFFQKVTAAVAPPAPTPQAEPVFPGVARDVWVQRMREMLPPAICKAPFFVQCFQVTTDDCMKAAREIGGRCIDEFLPQLPASFDEARGREWGSKIGECTGERLEHRLLSSKRADPKCSDPTQWQ